LIWTEQNNNFESLTKYKRDATRKKCINIMHPC